MTQKKKSLHPKCQRRRWTSRIGKYWIWQEIGLLINYILKWKQWLTLNKLFQFIIILICTMTWNIGATTMKWYPRPQNIYYTEKTLLILSACTGIKGKKNWWKDYSIGEYEKNFQYIIPHEGFEIFVSGFFKEFHIFYPKVMDHQEIKETGDIWWKESGWI